MKVHAFEAVLVKPAAVGSWTYVTVPFDVEELFGRKSQVRVKGTINGIAYKGSLMPHGNGTHFMVVNQALRDAAEVTAGCMVSVTMEHDEEERVVQVPDDFARQLEANEAAGAFFGQISYSYQKEYVSWIEAAKKPETRIDRVSKAIVKLTDGRKLK
ncbi:YdeI/OmpD-associated family protein [Paenibacillus sp. Soil522]|uniref:YdeI/OmpD-associated family protein n=1 Tax=Paenibacillus sp. Soil522 TaxID=1736388 RepID=UPI0006F4DAA5|nr:YdeI/OmpD-associated family protein [Paenibacillus sp. Soil522]KRE35416.1 hypothetical protein ASG81_21005 [Paenibacillus sp. Soil522]